MFCSKKNKLDLRPVIAVLLLGLLTPGVASAADQASELFSLEFLAPLINRVFGQGVIDVFVQSALSISGNLTGFALSLAGILAVISTLWSVMLAMTTRTSPLTAMLEPLIFSVLTYLLLSNYAMVVGDVVQLGKKLIQMSGSSLGDSFQDFVNSCLHAFQRLWRLTLDREGNLGLLQFLQLGVERLVTIVLLVLAFILMLLSIKTLVSVLLLGPVALGIGIAVGPLLIATLAGSYTRKWVDQWLAYMINATVLTAFVVIVLVLMKNSVTTVINDLVDVGNDISHGGTLGRVLALALIIASLGGVFSAVPDMVSAMLPGRLGGGARTMTMHPMAGAAAKNSGGAALAASGSVGGAAAGAVAGGAMGAGKAAWRATAAGFNKGRSGGGGGGGGNAPPSQGHQAIGKANASTSGSPPALPKPNP